MIPGPAIIRVCPTCTTQVGQRTLTSGNTFGATFWSDGKQEAPMLPDYPAVARCAACGHLFWLDDAEEVEHVAWGVGSGAAGPLPFAAPLDADGYRDAVAAGLGGTPEQEEYLRLHWWWAHNDPHRGVGSPEPPDDALRENLGILDVLLGREDDALPLRAAIALALGDFASAASRVDDASAAGIPGWVTSRLSALALNQEWRVVPFKP